MRSPTTSRRTVIDGAQVRNMRDLGYSNFFTYLAGEYLIRPQFGDARLLENRGFLDDLKIATMVATDLVSWFDPTGISDVIGGALQISEGQYLAGALRLGNGLVPFTNSAFGCSAATKLNTVVELGNAGMSINDGIGALRNGDPLGATMSFVSAGMSMASANSSFCFVAGTQVVVDFARNETVPGDSESIFRFTDGLVLMIWVGAAIQLRRNGQNKEQEHSRQRFVRSKHLSPKGPRFLPVTPEPDDSETEQTSPKAASCSTDSPAAETVLV